MRHDESNFDDAGLKDALKRAIPMATAPASLRARIEQACAEAGDVSTEPIRLTHGQAIRQWLNRGRRMAIAASIAGLGLGIGLFVMLDRAEQQDRLQYASNVSPVYVQTALVQHDQLQRSAADPQMRQTLLGYPQLKDRVRGPSPLYIPEPDLSSLGWQFVGAQPCQMRDFTAAQLFYTRGRETVSVFVLPQGNYAVNLRGCEQANECIFAKRGTSKSTLFVVARALNGKPTQDEIQAIADELGQR